ncbi:outer membrane protein [Desulfosediminicola sp.]|uniref:outer membrane protein n=1 Tax=Desulfosediminicola sp. TaxID=2886825 RepID=UPI003AF2102E
MKKAVILLTLAAVAPTGVQTATAESSSNFKVYVATEGGWSDTKLKAGGSTNYGGFYPTYLPFDGHDSDGVNFGTIKIGAEVNDNLRVDLGYAKYGDSSFVTSTADSFPYLIYTDLETEAVFLTVNYDYLQFEKTSFFIGGGIGVAMLDTDLEERNLANSLDLYGSDSTTNFAWKIETGVEYLLTDNFSLYGGLRFVDLGKVDIALKSAGMGGADAGSFTPRLNSKELFMGLRYQF